MGWFSEWQMPSFAAFRNWIGFFVLGLFNNFGYVIFLSAAEDIMKGSSGAVLLADILPTLCTKLIAPFFMHRIPYWLRVVVLTTAALGSFQLVAWGESAWLRLLGVVLASFSAGFGEITFLALASFYPKFTLSAWSSGTGGAGVLGAVAYLGLTEWIGLSSKISLLAVSPLPVLIAVSFFVFITGEQNKKKIIYIPVSEEDDLSPRSAVEVDEDDEAAPSLGGTYAAQPPPVVDTRGLSVQILEDSYAAPPPSGLPLFRMRMRRFFSQFALIKPLLPYMIPLFFVYYFEYAINSGISATLVFDGWGSDKVYKYYGLMYQIGVFVSRSSVDIFPIEKIWIPGVLQAANFVFLLCQAYWNFVPYVYIIFPIIFWEGLLGGATYVNSMYMIYKTISDKDREFSLGVVSLADDVGISLAALTSVFLEKWLRRHNNIH